ncbi:hypothetical protein YC2023_011278 [Brassica napus]
MERPGLIPKGRCSPRIDPISGYSNGPHRPISVLDDQENCDLVSRSRWIEPETCWRLSPVSLPLDHNHPVKCSAYIALPLHKFTYESVKKIYSGYKSLLPLNEECIFENISLMVVKMKSGTMKVLPLRVLIDLRFRSLGYFSS